METTRRFGIALCAETTCCDTMFGSTTPADLSRSRVVRRGPKLRWFSDAGPSRTVPRTSGGRAKPAKERNRGRGREVEPRRLYGDLRSARGGITMPGAGRGAAG